MTLERDDLAERLEAVLRRLPGVRDLYAAAPLVQQAVGELPLAATSRPALVHIVERDGVREIVVNVGVDPDGRAPVIAADVAEAVHAEAGREARVTVRVSRIA